MNGQAKHTASPLLQELEHSTREMLFSGLERSNKEKQWP
jgi:hypothetical protein